MLALPVGLSEVSKEGGGGPKLRVPVWGPTKKRL